MHIMLYKVIRLGVEILIVLESTLPLMPHTIMVLKFVNFGICFQKYYCILSWSVYCNEVMFIFPKIQSKKSPSIPANLKKRVLNTMAYGRSVKSLKVC